MILFAGIILSILFGAYLFWIWKWKNRFSKISDCIVIVDVETTGVSYKEDEIVEIGALKVNVKTNAQKSFQILIKTNKKITPSSVNVNGITAAMVKRKGKPLQEAIREFTTFAGDLPLVAYNPSFDISFLQRAALNHSFYLSNPIISVLKLTKRAFPDLKNYRLHQVAKNFNIPNQRYHRSLSDCKMTKEVYKIVLKKLESSENLLIKG